MSASSSPPSTPNAAAPAASPQDSTASTSTPQPSRSTPTKLPAVESPTLADPYYQCFSASAQLAMTPTPTISPEWLYRWGPIVAQ
jgi:hypothetical protein